MESRVLLKICEGCGCLWFRAQTEGSVYCKGCTAKLIHFPTPQSRRRRGRPSRKLVALTWTAAALGGAK